ncbi:MAG TPA: hypothetical protein VF912_09335 [Anaeromyxobacter sp.]
MATTTMEEASGRTFPRLHWGAIAAGVLLALAAHVVMELIGAALGFAAAPADSRAVGTAAAIWALITPFVATVLGAWLACRIAAADDSRAANVHGVLVWCIGLIAGALFLAGTMASGAMTAGMAASGNVGAAQRMIRGDTGARPGGRAVEASDAAKAAAASSGAAALAAIAGLLGAIVGAGLSQRRAMGRGRRWGLTMQRREEERAAMPGHLGDGGFGTTYGATPTAPPPRAPGASPASPTEPGAPTDPYHH